MSPELFQMLSDWWISTCASLLTAITLQGQGPLWVDPEGKILFLRGAASSVPRTRTYQLSRWSVLNMPDPRIHAESGLHSLTSSKRTVRLGRGHSFQLSTKYALGPVSGVGDGTPMEPAV